MPYFSIIIPLYNRERFISRAINSCLKQDFDDFEIIVVDDYSTDNSIKVVQEFNDNRIILICHNLNRGVGPARNTGIDVAQGEWVIFLDSDDELTPNALLLIYQRAKQVNNKIARINFMCRLDSGLISPDPPFAGEVQDFKAYIRWVESVYHRRGESFKSVRRTTFDIVRYPDDRGYESLYNFPFAEHFLQKCFPDVCYLYHQDADYQLVRPDSNRLFLIAYDHVSNNEALLDRYGEALSKWAPRVYESKISGLATLQFLAGNRIKGFKYVLLCLRRNPLSLRTWAIFVFGMIGAKLIALVKTKRQKLKSG